MYEGARENLPLASVDDPGEYFVPAGQDRQVNWLILKKMVSFDGQFSKNQFQTGGVPGVELASDNDLAKDTGPSEQELKVTSFARWSALSNKQLQEDQVAGIVSDKGPLAGEDDPDLLRSLRTIQN